MIKTLLFDFSWVLAFPYTSQIGSSAAYKKAQAEKQPWQKYLTLNQELINIVQKYQAQYPSYIFSASSQKMLSDIKVQLVPPFNQVFSSKELSLYKHQPLSYKKIAQLIKAPSNEILFIDDNISNVEAAQQAGMISIEFESNENLFPQLEQLLQIKV